MIYLCVRQTVRNYAQWKEAFDIHLSARQAGGALNKAILLRNIEKPQEIIIIVGWKSLQQAKSYLHSISWQMALQEMGEVVAAEVRFLERIG